MGGADHKTGSKIDLSNAYNILEDKVRKYYPDCKVLYKWNTEDCITLDKIPYIGEFSHFMTNMYIGTGFNKATRLHPIKNNAELGNMIKETANSLVINKFKVPDADLDVIEDNSVMSGSKKAGNFEEIKNDSGHVLKYNGQTIGIYKDNDGKIFAVNPICTHLGCLLSWNNLDKTWDCPCHGSRFDYKGHQLYNPAIRDLDVIDLS